MTTHATPRRYRYRAARPDGHIVRGTLAADDERDVSEQVAARGMMLLRAEAVTGRRRGRRVRARDLAVVFRNVATLVASGVPIEGALAVSEPLVPPHLAETLADVRRRIRGGKSVAEALEAGGELFPRAVVGVIRAGERGGEIARACESVALQLEQEAHLRAHVRSALAYPVLILFVGLATVIVMGTVVVPRFADVLGELGAELPPSTRALLAVSNFAQRFGPLLALAAVGMAAIATRWAFTPHVRARIDGLLLGLPIVGGLRLGFASARACRALGGMLTSGMPLLPALDAAATATGDLEVSRRLANSRAAVARGARLTQALEAQRALSPLALQLVGVGEATGRLGPMLSRAGELVAEDADRSLRTAVALLEPALVVTLGLLVAGVAAALLQAVYSVRPG